MFIDKSSLRRSFHEVFGINNNELALRFALIFCESLDLPKIHKIDIIRYFYILQQLFHPVSNISIINNMFLINIYIIIVK